MNVNRGLIIADPWIEHILEGRKDWEMRAQATATRGWFGLIRKGSGQVVGIARLVDCGKALSQSEMIANIDHHRIPEVMIRRGEVEKWVVPWKLSDIIPLEKPVPYEHKSGAVTWVALSTEVAEHLGRHLISVGAPVGETISRPTRTLETGAKLTLSRVSESSDTARQRPPTAQLHPIPEGESRVLGRSRLSGGNVRNNHINLSSFLNAFPQDAIGGRNKSEAAPRQLQIDWGGPQHVITDIDGTKAIFRGRGWVRRFFSAANAQEGNIVIVTQTSPYSLIVRLERASSR